MNDQTTPSSINDISPPNGKPKAEPRKEPATSSNPLTELMEILKLEKIEENIYRGLHVDLGTDNVFGGQVLGQALSAASQTVPSDRYAHSLHGYFMRHGDLSIPIMYNVECIRDGKSFTTRRVVAVQKGRAIFSMGASFHIEEPGFDHHDSMPDVPGPEGIHSEKELANQAASDLPERIRKRVKRGFPIEFRHVNPLPPFAPRKLPPHKYIWFRITGPVPKETAIQRCLLSYASDFNLVVTSLYPHGHTIWEEGMQGASLDHAMWFHREFDIADWLLYAVDSPNASNARGLSIGKIFNRQGQLVATVAQEGLIRYLPLSGQKKLSKTR